MALEEKDKNRFVDWLTHEEIMDYFTRERLWSKEHEEFLETSDKKAEDLKVGIYTNFRNPSSLEAYRKKLRAHERTTSRLYAQKHALDHLTLEGYCDLVKNDYLLKRSIYNSDDKLYFGDNINHSEFEDVSNFLAMNVILPYQFRKIARAAQWSYYWHSKTAGNLFNVPVAEWTDEQRILAAMTRMYDGAREHMECPDDDVFEDDDAFDGWAISERRKNEKERSKSRAEKMLPGNLKNASEIYVMAHNKNQAQDIINLNDSQATGIIQERKRAIRQSGEIKEVNLPDVQRDLTISSNAKRMEHFRNKKK